MRTYDLLPFGFGRESVGRSVLRDMSKLLETFGDLTPLGGTAVEWAPRVDVAETPKAITVQAELPGLSQQDLDVQVHGNLLTIKGQKTLEREEKDTNWHVVERRSGSFSRTIQLPFEPADEAVDASFKDGVLHITVAKPEHAGAKKITVKTA